MPKVIDSNSNYHSEWFITVAEGVLPLEFITVFSDRFEVYSDDMSLVSQQEDVTFNAGPVLGSTCGVGGLSLQTSIKLVNPCQGSSPTVISYNGPALADAEIILDVSSGEKYSLLLSDFSDTVSSGSGTCGEFQVHSIVNKDTGADVSDLVQYDSI